MLFKLTIIVSCFFIFDPDVRKKIFLVTDFLFKLSLHWNMECASCKVSVAASGSVRLNQTTQSRATLPLFLQIFLWVNLVIAEHSSAVASCSKNLSQESIDDAIITSKRITAKTLDSPSLFNKNFWNSLKASKAGVLHNIPSFPSSVISFSAWCTRFLTKYSLCFAFRQYKISRHASTVIWNVWFDAEEIETFAIFRILLTKRRSVGTQMCCIRLMKTWRLLVFFPRRNRMFSGC